MKVVFNKAEAMDRLGNDKELFALLVGTFLRELPVYLSDIVDALETKENRNIEKAAHRLKGAAATVGLESARVTSFELEKSARAGDEFSSLKKQAENLRLHMQEAGPLLKGWLDTAH